MAYYDLHAGLSSFAHLRGSMGWFTRKPSALEMTLEFMREERGAQLELQRSMVNAMQTLVNNQSEQSKTLQGWIKMFTEAPKPEVRVMTDLDEARLEQKRQAKDPVGLPVGITPEDAMSQMQELIADLKADI